MADEQEEQLPPEQIEVLRKAFDAFDREKNGSISCNMVEEILRMMGQPFNRAILEELIEEVDADKSGRLEFDEFLVLAAKFIVEEDAEAMEKELREAFRLYDKEGEQTFSRNIDMGSDIRFQHPEALNLEIITERDCKYGFDYQTSLTTEIHRRLV